MKTLLTLVSGWFLSLSAVGAPRQGGYEDAFNFFARRENATLMPTASFEEVQQSLTRQFNDICGDTFCAGDYSNLTPISLDCSINAAAQLVGQCLWSFAGSYSSVDARTGKLTTSKRVFECDLGFRGTPTELAAFLTEVGEAGDGSTAGLRSVTVPGSNRNLMDVLVGCL